MDHYNKNKGDSKTPLVYDKLSNKGVNYSKSKPSHIATPHSQHQTSPRNSHVATPPPQPGTIKSTVEPRIKATSELMKQSNGSGEDIDIDIDDEEPPPWMKKMLLQQYKDRQKKKALKLKKGS